MRKIKSESKSSKKTTKRLSSESKKENSKTDQLAVTSKVLHFVHKIEGKV